MSPLSVLVACAVAMALCFAGMAALSLAMDRHQEQLTGRHELPRAQRWAWRIAGVAVLALSLWHCLAAWGATVGSVAWWGFLTAGALAVVITLTYRPGWLLRAAGASGAVALMALCAPPLT